MSPSHGESTSGDGNDERAHARDDSPDGQARPAAHSFLALWALAIFGRSRRGCDTPDVTPRGRGPPP
jgi:hypothetical protein